MGASRSASDGSGPLRILLIEDDPDWAELLLEALLGETKSAGQEVFRVLQVDCWHAAQAELEKAAFDGILLDLSLPDAAGSELVEFAHAQAPSLPIVILSGRSDDRAAVEAVKQGAQEYLVKSEFHPSLLRRTLRYAIERHRFQRVLEETQRRQIELRDEFLSHVSHELRTPLTAIHQFVTILLDGLAGELEKEPRDYLAIVLRNTLQLRAMVEDLLDVTRSESGKLRVEPWPVAPQAVIDDVVASWLDAASQRRVKLAVAKLGALPDVFADELRTRQVLANLVTNAIKFTPAGGSIEVAARPVAGGSAVEFEVHDTGPGIAEERREPIFRRLAQEPQYCEGSRKGLGLGLFIARELVTLMDGEIGVESALGRGSRFWFRLPTYSLARLLAPILEPDLHSPVSLLTVHIEAEDPAAEAPSGADEALSLLRQRVRDLVTSDRDLVLPRLRQADLPVGGRIHVVARVDGAGAETMRARVERGIARFAPLQGYGLAARVSVCPLQPPRTITSAAAVAEHVAAQVLEHVKVVV